MTYEIKIKKHTLWKSISIILVLIIIGFFIFYFHPPIYEEEYFPERNNNLHTFSFTYEDGHPIGFGEIFFDDLFMGDLDSGNLTFENLNYFPSYIILKGTHLERYFELYYEFPTEYLQSYENYFVVYEESIDDYDLSLELAKNDTFNHTDKFHWHHMPLKYYIDNSELNKQSQIELRTWQYKEVVKRINEKVPSITFEEVPLEEFADIIFHSHITTEQREEFRDSPFDGNVQVFYDPKIIGNIFVNSHIYVEPTGVSIDCQHPNHALWGLLRSLGVPDEYSYPSRNCILEPISVKDINYLKDIYEI